MPPLEPIPRAWRLRAPPKTIPGPLYGMVRQYLCDNGGSCLRSELLDAIRADPTGAERLERGQGLSRLLNNMKHSGDVFLDGERVVASARAYRRLGMTPRRTVLAVEGTTGETTGR